MCLFTSVVVPASFSCNAVIERGYLSSFIPLFFAQVVDETVTVAFSLLYSSKKLYTTGKGKLSAVRCSTNAGGEEAATAEEAEKGE